ncbi:MAG: hypothetical protein IPJ26_01885 [Bacteroidetes bacterium]|nr:hypothetical protein [Bacteroidota bacterium]
MHVKKIRLSVLKIKPEHNESQNLLYALYNDDLYVSSGQAVNWRGLEIDAAKVCCNNELASDAEIYMLPDTLQILHFRLEIKF